MLKRIVLLLTLLTAMVSTAADTNSFTITACDYTLPVHRKGMFAGESGGALIVGGGLDAAGLPSGEVYVRSPGDDAQWQKQELRIPIAFGACATAEFTEPGAKVRRIYIAGGLAAGGITNCVQVLEWKDGALLQTELPQLPVALAAAGAGFFNDQKEQQLMVAGGTSSASADTALDTLYRITLNDEANTGWEQLPPMPCGGRLLPSVICFYNDVHVFGGFVPEKRGSAAVYTPQTSAYGYRWKVIDGNTESGWHAMTPMQEPLAAAAVFQTGQVHAGVAGGVNAPFEGTLFTPTPFTSGTSAIRIYHNVTDTWVEKGSLPESVGAGTAVRTEKGWSLVDGAEVYDMTLNRTVRNMRVLDYVTLFGYFIGVVFIGLYFTRKQRSSESFALADRKVAWWMAGISMFASGASSISLIAIPAQAFRTSMIWAFPFLMLIPLFFLEAYVIYPLIRKLNLTSTYEYLARRYHPSLRYIASLQCIAMQIFGRMNMVLLLPALAISAVTGLSIMTSVLLMGIVTTIYTTQGGLKAVILVEFVQGITMLIGITAIIWLAIGGLPGGFSDFVEIGMDFGRFNYAIWDLDFTMPIFWLIVLTPMLTKLAFAADQPVVQRVFATPLKDVRKLAAMFLFCSVFIAFAVNIAGISVFTFFQQNPAQLDPAMTNDQVIPLYIVQRIPAGLAGLIIASIFAAAASTLSSSMNSVATIFTEDFYRLARPKATDRERLITMRVVTVVAGIIATGCALYMGQKNLRSLFKTWNELFALLGGGFLGIYILGIFSHRTNAIGAATGALASIAVTVFVKNFTTLHWYGYMPVAVFSCMIIGYVVSLLVPGKAKDLSGLTVFDLKRDLE